MYCRKCNIHYQQEAQFCNVCGTPLDKPNKKIRTKSRKKKIFWITLSVFLAIALIVWFLLYIFIFSTPEYRLYNALDNTIDELEEIMQNAEDFYKGYELLLDLYDDKAFSCNLDYQYRHSSDGSYISKHDYEISLDYNFEDKELDGDFKLLYENPSGNELFSGIFSADRENLYAQLDQLNNRIYSIPLGDLSEPYKSSNFPKIYSDIVEMYFEYFSLNPFFDASNKKDDSVNFRDADIIIEFSDDTIPGFPDLEVVRLELYDDVIINVGINDDDCIEAVYGYSRDQEDEAIIISLEGDDNMWNDVVYVGSNDVDTIHILETRQGFKIEDEDGDTIFECNDMKHRLIIEDDQIIEYALTDNGVTVNWESIVDYYTYEYDYYDYGYGYREDVTEIYNEKRAKHEIEISHFDEVTQIDSEAIPLFSLSQKEVESFADNLHQADPNNTFKKLLVKSYFNGSSLWNDSILKHIALIASNS